jgi:hypothetical protein
MLASARWKVFQADGASGKSIAAGAAGNPLPAFFFDSRIQQALPVAIIRTLAKRVIHALGKM